MDNFGDLIADQKAETSSGNENLTLTATTPDGLTPGTYYIAVGIFSGGITINGNITATLTTNNGLVAPQFVDGSGWSTTLFLTNVSQSSEGVDVQFYGEDGAPNSVPLVGEGNLTSIRETLDPAATITLQTDTPPSLQSGWVLVVPDTPAANRLQRMPLSARWDYGSDRQDPSLHFRCNRMPISVRNGQQVCRHERHRDI